MPDKPENPRLYRLTAQQIERAIGEVFKRWGSHENLTTEDLAEKVCYMLQEDPTVVWSYPSAPEILVSPYAGK